MRTHARVEAGSSIASGLCVFIAVRYVTVHCERSGETCRAIAMSIAIGVSESSV